MKEEGHNEMEEKEKKKRKLKGEVNEMTTVNRCRS